MSAGQYSGSVRALFAATEHAGTLENATQVLHDDQGVRLELSAVAKNGHIEQLRFRAWGCPHVLAAAEYFCAEYEGRATADLAQFTATGLMQSLAVPVEKSGRILVIEDAVRALGAAIREASSPTEQD
ncbi:MAG: iron-sulfur cluster assembly scaffold protein [Woeseiaceae bacterium]